ncbi:MAG: DUF99 family protein [Gammaproteobacteria bacterium]
MALRLIPRGVAMFSHVVGFDDEPFEPGHRGDVGIVGAVFCELRLEGVLRGKVRRDGANATQTILSMIGESRFAPQLQAVLLQGIAVAGFNVVDVTKLYRELSIPVLVVVRKAPDLAAIKEALCTHVGGGVKKWRLIERLGPPQPAAGVMVQRIGIDYENCERLIERLAINSTIPEPLRTAHLIAAGVGSLKSRQRV